MKVRLLLDRLKKIKNITHDKELAKELKINYFTLRGWLQRNSLNLQLIIDYALKHNIDLNYLFNNFIPINSINNTIFIQSNLDPELDTLYKEAIAVLGDEEVKKLLKEKMLQKILDKIFSQEKRIKEIFTSILSPKQHIVLILYFLTKQLSQKNLENIDNPKEFLIKQIENFRPEDKRAILSKLDKIKLISKIEKLTDKEAEIFVKNLSDALPLLEEEMSLINKLTFS